MERWYREKHLEAKHYHLDRMIFINSLKRVKKNMINYKIELKSITIISVILFSLIFLNYVKISAQPEIYKDKTSSPQVRTNDLISRMTLEEKVAQLAGFGIGKSEFGDKSASIFGTEGNERLGIPKLVMGHGITGVRSGRDENVNATYMMTPIGIAASWNTELYFSASEAVAKEMRALNQNLNLGTTLNIIRNPLGGRNWECFSEDPFLTSRMAVANVKAMQKNGIISGPKHFVANNQENNRFDINNVVDERTLREIYLPAFKAAIQEGGALNIMSAYNRVNGTFMSENMWLLTDVLRNEWNFQGFVLSDFGKAVHSTVPTAKAGMNIEMSSPKWYGQKLTSAINKGEIEESVIDRLLYDKLFTMFSMGLFDDKWYQPEEIVHCKNHQNIALQVARESAVLLKNENSILPLNIKEINKLAVIGPNAKRYEDQGFYYLQGGGSARCYYIKDAVKNPVDEIQILAKGVDVQFAQGCKPYQNKKNDKKHTNENIESLSINDDQLIAEAVELAKSSDNVVLVVGLNGEAESEGRDRKSAKLPDKQIELIKEVSKINSNTVVVVVSGSYVEMSEWIDDVDGVLFHFYCGEKIGQAMAEILFGEVNPSGKLPISYPVSVEQYPSSSIQSNVKGYSKSKISNVYSEGIFVGYRYFDKYNEEILFPFGFGLGYSNFEYGNLSVEQNEKIEINVTVKNTGTMSGKEIVQLYVQDKKCSFPRPLRELKGFKKIHLKPNEEKEVSFMLGSDAFAFWSPEMKDWIVEPGEFVIEVGSSSRDILMSKTIVK